MPFAILSDRTTRPSSTRAAPHGAFRWEPLAVALLLAVNALLAWTVLVPHLGGIGLWDESNYVHLGQELAGGTLPSLSGAPLVAALYAAIYPLVRHSPFWFVYAVTAGRVILFLLLWLAAYAAAAQLRRRVPPLAVLGLFAISPVASGLVQNGSDALFAALATFALAGVLAYHRDRRPTALAFASACVGLSALARGEGILLFAILLGIAFALSPRGGRVAALTAAATPFALVLGAYMALFGAVTGRFELGTGKRAYFSFEQGQGLASASEYPKGVSVYAEGQVDARRLYGTEEQNGGSVVRAIVRNPSAYVARVGRMIMKVPGILLTVYGGVVALLLLALALRGTWALWQDGESSLVAVLAVWPAHLLMQLLLVYRPQHFLLPYAVLLLPAGAGLAALALVRGRGRERLAWAAALLLTALAGLTLGKPSLVRFGLLLLPGLALLALAAAARRARPPRAWLQITAVTAALVLGLGLQGLWPRIERRTLGTAPDERAMLVLERELPAGTPVGAESPGIVWAAGMTHVAMDLELRGLKGEADLVRWLESRNVAAVYADDRLRRREPAVWALVSAEVGNVFDVAFAEGDVQILTVRRGAFAGGEVLAGHHTHALAVRSRSPRARAPAQIPNP